MKFCILLVSAIGMQICDEASPNIISEGRGLLMKMLITLESVGIFLSHFAYL